MWVNPGIETEEQLKLYDVYWETDDLAIARQKLDKIRLILANEHGAEHPETMNAAAHVYELDRRLQFTTDEECEYSKLLQKTAEALESGDKYDWNRFVQIYESLYQSSAKLLGPNCWRTLSYQQRFAEGLAMVSRFSDAANVNRDLLQRLTLTFGRDHPKVPLCRVHLASNLSHVGDLVEARTLLESSCNELAQSLGTQAPLSIWARAQLADVRFAAGDADAAISEMYSVLNDVKESDPAGQLAAIYRKTIDFLIKRGRLTEAESVVREAILDCKDSPQVADYLGLEDLLSAIWSEQGKTLMSLRQSRRVFSVAKSMLGAANSTTLGFGMNYVDAATHAGYDNVALEIAREIVALTAQTPETDPAAYLRSLRMLAMSLVNAGEYREALSLIEPFFQVGKYLEIDGEFERDGMVELYAIALRHTGSVDQAAKFYRDYLGTSLNDSPAALDLLAKLEHARHNDAEAERLTTQVIQLEAENESIPLRVERLNRLGAISYGQGRTAEAREFWEQATEVFDRLPDTLSPILRDKRYSSHLMLARLAAEENRPYDVWRHLDSFYGLDITLRLVEKNNLSSAPTLSEIQKSIPADTAIVAWIDDIQEAERPKTPSWLCILRSMGEPMLVVLPVDNSPQWIGANSLSSRLFRLMSDPNSDYHQVGKLADETFRLRFPDFHEYFGATDQLPEARNIVIVSGAGTERVPFQAVFDLRTVPSREFYVSYTPSASAFSLLANSPTEQQRDVARYRIAGWADPTGNLPFARSNAMWLNGHFEESKILIGQLQERAISKFIQDALAHSQFLHFATHIEPNDRYPMQTAMRLNRNDDPELQVEEDDVLTAEEVYESWDVRAELVAVMGCGSNVGVFSQSGGNLAFENAFLAAGARSVMTTSWPINDQATALLESRFYQNLVPTNGQLGMSPQMALRNAQQWLRRLSLEQVEELVGGYQTSNRGTVSSPVEISVGRPFEHPYFWASFSVSGSIEPCRTRDVKHED